MRRALAPLLAPLVLVPLLLVAALAGCKREPLPADPAIWHVTGSHGEEAWLFGTIHAAPRPIAWETPKVRAALDRADEIVVEIANVGDQAALAEAFTALARTPGLPPVAARVPLDKRAALAKMLAERGIKEADLNDTETWAVALTLARPPHGDESRNGVDRAVLDATRGKPVVELEGARQQLSIFDTLPEAEQRDLLLAVLGDSGALDDSDQLVAIWRDGDMARIEGETKTGLLADPELRAALFTGRNLRWSARIVGEMNRRHRPFVAVGAAHMAGPDGLVALLQGAGFTVRRVE